jgi:hypothetical protein
MVSSIGKVPEMLLQAGSQAAGAATQSLGAVMTPKLEDPSADSGDRPALDEPGADAVGGGGGGSGETTAGETAPAGGGAPSTPSVVPSTGPAPTPPSTPAGALPPPAAASTGPSGMGTGLMPMGMPLAGMGGPGGQGGQDRGVRHKNRVVPQIAHTESVTGKVNADRIAVSATASQVKEPEPPNDDGDNPPQQPLKPIIHRITTPPPKNPE